MLFAFHKLKICLVMGVAPCISTKNYCPSLTSHVFGHRCKKTNFTKIIFKDTIQSGHCDNVLVDLGVAMVVVVVMVFLSLFSFYNGGHGCNGVIVVSPILTMAVVAMMVFMLLFLLLRWWLWS